MHGTTNLKNADDVLGSVHHSTIHKEKSNKIKQCIKILLFRIYIKLDSFGRHTAHHQDPKTELAASGFSYVEGCWTCSWWTLSGTVLRLTMSTNYTFNPYPANVEKLVSL